MLCNNAKNKTSDQAVLYEKGWNSRLAAPINKTELLSLKGSIDVCKLPQLFFCQNRVVERNAYFVTLTRLATPHLKNNTYMIHYTY